MKKRILIPGIARFFIKMSKNNSWEIGPGVLHVQLSGEGVAQKDVEEK